MRLAIFADIHANRQAFSACLDFARARGAERIVCLGDIVGYGADPEWAVDTVMGLVDDGAIAVIGNHDHAISTPSESMNAVAQAAIEWTRGRLSAPQRRFLAELPLTRREDDRLYVHSEASHPARWHYVRDTPDAARSIAATDAHVTFCGHIHRPALYSMSSAAKMTSFIPTSTCRCNCSAAGAGSPCSARSGSRATATRRRRSRCSIPHRARSPIAACLTMSRRRRTGSAPTACRTGWPIACSWGNEAMAKPVIEPGAELDGFTIGERVHQGGMATLWTVTHPGINVPLLMKVPRVAEGEDPAAIVSFEMEQMIVPRLAGPHVPGCFGTGDFDRQPYVVMERIPGKTLYSRIDQLPIPYEEARVIGGQIATALADLHRQNVIHHDIKPSSIMFRPSGECVLIDFGLSHHNQLPDLLQEEFRLPYGTAPYMAPERLLGVRDDPRSDLFSLGVLLYFFTTGERPFGESETLRGMRRQAVARSLSAAQAQARLSAMAAGNRAALPGDRAGVASSDGFATGVRTGPSRTGQADGAVGAAASAIRSPRCGAAASIAA